MSLHLPTKLWIESNKKPVHGLEKKYPFPPPSVLPTPSNQTDDVWTFSNMSHFRVLFWVMVDSGCTNIKRKGQELSVKSLFHSPSAPHCALFCRYMVVVEWLEICELPFSP